MNTGYAWSRYTQPKRCWIQTLVCYPNLCSQTNKSRFVCIKTHTHSINSTEICTIYTKKTANCCCQGASPGSSQDTQFTCRSRLPLWGRRQKAWHLPFINLTCYFLLSPASPPLSNSFLHYPRSSGKTLRCFLREVFCWFVVVFCVQISSHGAVADKTVSQYAAVTRSWPLRVSARVKF